MFDDAKFHILTFFVNLKIDKKNERDIKKHEFQLWKLSKLFTSKFFKKNKCVKFNIIVTKKNLKNICDYYKN